MAIGEISGQYRYTGKGPVDAKQLIKTYDELLLESTWASASGSNTAYNGMIVAVWLDKNEDKTLSNRNGIYFLFDSNCTSTLKKPDVTNEANWHKIGETSDAGDFAERFTQIESDLADMKSRIEELEDKASQTFALRELFPKEGIEGKLYIALDTEKTYVWVNGSYLCVGDDTESYTVICGGDASNE